MAEPLLSAHGLTRHFGGVLAVDHVSIDLRPGEIHAVIGTNGAGKSTLINLLAGELAPTSGEVSLSGHALTGAPPHRLASLGVGRTFQRSNVFPDFTAFENCRLAAQARNARPWAVHEKALRCPTSGEAARRALAAVGLSRRSDVLAGLLSHGERRELEIAMCLATEPKVLLLDEPLAGMGAEESQRVLALLRELKPERAILLVEHDMDAVFAIADVITVMADGAVLAAGLPEAVRADPSVREAYLGDAL
ncbi:MAG TPA: ABC transporter ATP-binding protein [Casimicrobiaceae bacterium]|nr:ABC transporter ATP-binding protein [Casimicrobiaceae bacterium]